MTANYYKMSTPRWELWKPIFHVYWYVGLNSYYNIGIFFIYMYNFRLVTRAASKGSSSSRWLKRQQTVRAINNMRQYNYWHRSQCWVWVREEELKFQLISISFDISLNFVHGIRTFLWRRHLRTTIFAVAPTSWLSWMTSFISFNLEESWLTVVQVQVTSW